MHKQSLTFSVRIARTRNDLNAACRVRATSYGHHVPQLGQALLEPDLLDADENALSVLCVDKASGAAVGTARFQTNAGGKLLIEHSVSLPHSLRNDSRAEITRLSAIPGADPLVKVAMMKASYLFCIAAQVRWMVICARKDALIRQYRRLGFTNLLDDSRIPMLHVGKLDHQVLKLNVTAVERSWREERNSLYDFFFDTVHPDIQLFSTEPALPVRQRAHHWSAPTRVRATRAAEYQVSAPAVRMPSVEVATIG